MLGKRGLLTKGRYFSITTFSSTKPYAQIAVVVGVVVDKRASGRNEVRRFLYDRAFDLLRGAPPRAIIIRAFPAVKGAPKRAILDELKNLLA